MLGDKSLDMSKDIEALKELDEISIGYETWLERKTLLQAIRMQFRSLLISQKFDEIKELEEIISKNDEKILTDYAIKHNLIRGE